MLEMFIDLYSDTKSQRIPGMRMIASATGGDEQKDEDTVLKSCERVAQLLGKEGVVLLPCDTMCNEIALAIHCRPKDEAVCGRAGKIRKTLLELSLIKGDFLDEVKSKCISCWWHKIVLCWIIRTNSEHDLYRCSRLFAYFVLLRIGKQFFSFRISIAKTILVLVKGTFHGFADQEYENNCPGWLVYDLRLVFARMVNPTVSGIRILALYIEYLS